MTKKIIVCTDGFVSIDEFKDILDIEKVVYYRVKPKKDKTLIITFMTRKRN